MRISESNVPSKKKKKNPAKRHTGALAFKTENKEVFRALPRTFKSIFCVFISTNTLNTLEGSTIELNVASAET